MSKERELLRRWLIECMWRGSNMSLLEETKEFLAQPEQTKLEPLSDEWIKDNIHLIHRDVSFTDLVRAVEKAHRIGEIQ